MQRYNAGDVDGVMELMDPDAQCTSLLCKFISGFCNYDAAP